MHFSSDAMKIGKHEWRVIVVDGRFSPRVTEYQWRPIGAQSWQGSRQWPSYDINNGMTLGMPKRLAALYAKNEMAIKESLKIAA